MDDIYTPAVLNLFIQLLPHEIACSSKEQDERIVKKLNKHFSGSVSPQFGYIKPNSIQLLERTLGMFKGSELNSSMCYKVKVLVQQIDTSALKWEKVTATVKENIPNAGLLASIPTLPFIFYAERVEDNPHFDNATIGKQVVLNLSSNLELIEPSLTNNFRAQWWVKADLLEVCSDKELDVKVSLVENLTPSLKFGVPLRLHTTSIKFEQLETAKERIAQTDLLFQDHVGANVLAKLGFEHNLWSSHVRYIICNYEMHPSSDWKHLAHLLKKSILDHGKLNRAYWKMRILLHVYGLIDDSKTTNFSAACIAESPGGFVQAVVDTLVGYDDCIGPTKTNLDQCFVGCISKAVVNENPWESLTRELTNSSYASVVNTGIMHLDDIEPLKLNVRTTEETNGDIMVEENRELFYSLYAERKAHLVTADGGFHRDKTSSANEEADLFPLLCAEALMALRIQAIGGHFVLKIFDMTLKPTLDLVALLRSCYSEVYVTKPKTSRLASSEKYVVCKGFLGANSVPSILQEVVDSDQPVEELISNPASVELVDFSNHYMDLQLNTIEKGHIYVTTYLNQPTEAAQKKLIEGYMEKHTNLMKGYLESIALEL